jgi:hypothetical protein
MLRLATLGALTFGVVWTVLVAGPTFSQTPDGTVTATVQVNIGPCISIDPTSFTYAPAGFSSGGTNTTTVPNTTKPVVTNCSNQTENILARGSNASGTGALWTLTGASINCSNPTQNTFRHEVKQSSTGDYMALTSSNQTWEASVPTTAGDKTRTLDGRLTMPCTGSTGGGVTMTMSIFLTAVIP